MISASQLARAAAQLDGLAGRLSGAAEHLARVHQQASEHAASLRTAWDGPLPAAVTAGASNYITQVDGHPAADAVPAVQQWAASAREHADALLTIEMRRSRTAYELAHTTPASIGIGPEAEELAADRRRALSSELSAIDREVEQLHEDWTRTCTTYAGTIDSFSAALRAQAAVSAVSEFAAASPGSFAWLDPTAMAAFLASLSASELAALFGDAEVVQDWWDSLSDEERIAFVAARPGGFTGALDEVVESWKDGLDADGLRALYTAVAMAKAGIDPATWDPTQGFAANQANVYAVYDYYSSLYLSDPEKFWWAGMASMIGPSFVAGMTDLSDAGTISEVIARLAAMGSTMPGIPGSISGLTSLSAAELEEELEFYEVTLLQMQKEIFLDMAVAHEAYLDGGMDTIERLYADDPYGHGSDAITAWRRIDEGAASGDTDMVAGGNRDLLLPRAVARHQRRLPDDAGPPGHGRGVHLRLHGRRRPVDPRRQRLRRGVPDQRRGACQHRRRSRRVVAGRPAARRGRGRGGHRNAPAGRQRRQLRRPLGAHRGGHAAGVRRAARTRIRTRPPASCRHRWRTASTSGASGTGSTTS